VKKLNASVGPRTSGRKMNLSPVVQLFFVILAVAFPSTAMADFGFKEVNVEFLNADKTPATKAGTHPFEMVTSFSLNSEIVPGSAVDPDTNEEIDGEVPEGQLRNLTSAQPPGFVGSQTAIPQCTQVQFTNITEGGFTDCPSETAVGYASSKAEFSVFPVGEEVFLHSAIYNLEPPPGVAARFGFIAATLPVTFDVLVSEEPPYNLVARIRNTPQSLLVYGSKITLWGNPADEAHDDLRGKCVGEPVLPTPDPVSRGTCPVETDEVPLLTLPRACEGPQQTVFAATSWQGDSDGAVATAPAVSACDLLPFSPQLAGAQPSTSSAESSAGIDVDLKVDDPGLEEADGTAQSDIRSVRLTLPEGMTANPSAAAGQGVCTPAQYNSASLADPGCPQDAKLGTVRIETPLLGETISGTVYLAQPRANPFNSLLAAYLVIRNPNLGLFIQQAGMIEADPQTGRLTSTFADIPQLPFSHLNVHFRGGPRAPLVTPPRCGTYTATSQMVPWSGYAAVSPSASFAITSGPGGTACPTGPGPFSPSMEAAGTLDSAAGAYSPFYMRLTRSDLDQEITRFDAVLPQGLVGKIAGVERCPDSALAAAEGKSGNAEIATPSCPAGSRIGSILAGAGVGSELTYVPGTIYLAGPYAGHPLSVAVVTPAVAGPFDVGTVVVREALDLDPITAEVQVDGSTDPIPRILEGIPLKLRELRVFLDRDKFTLNATSCEPKDIRATLFGSAGASALASKRYQASACGKLGFKPKLKIALKGGTQRTDHPALRSVLTPRPGDANIGKAVVTLPPTTFIDPTRISNPCTRVQFNAGACPKSSILGRAKAVTPLLDQPLEGPVYFRSNGGERDLPDIVADLRGQFRIVLVGFIDSKNGGLRTRFLNVPDAPVSKFTLNLKGGKKGLLQNSASLCAKKRRVKLQLTGQNGRTYNTSPLVGTSCKKKKGGGKGDTGGKADR
jgi:hypothetical protein